jgi:hypothetical protein
MDARTRVRQFLASGTADRPPFLAMVTEYTARLAQCRAAELLADPGLFVRSFQQSVTVLGLEAIIVEVPAARVQPVATGGDPASCGLDVLREDLHRLRATLRDQVAIVAPLPGPMTLLGPAGVAATPESMDDLVAGLIAVQEYLGPTGFDALALLERAGVGDEDVPGLADAAAAFWNVARYYSLPSLLIAAQGTARLAAAGPAAVAAWSGASARELLAGGARAAGQPPPADPAPLPPGGFYLSAGEIPAEWEVGAVRSLIRRSPVTL